LLLFAMGAKRIPLNRVGFIHYLTPTCFFILGRFVYHEPFSLLQFSGFILIWIALAIYSFLK
jgi:chloramphenicol-sensitive protein RarD